jgi:hypothetical protein
MQSHAHRAPIATPSSRTTRFQTRIIRPAAWHKGFRTPHANSAPLAHIGSTACVRAGEVDCYQYQLSISQRSHSAGILCGSCYSDLPWHIAIVEVMQCGLHSDRLHRMPKHAVAVLLSYASPL